MREMSAAHTRATKIGRNYLRNRMRHAAKQDVEARFAQAMIDGQKALVHRFAAWLQVRPCSANLVPG